MSDDRYKVRKRYTISKKADVSLKKSFGNNHRIGMIASYIMEQLAKEVEANKVVAKIDIDFTKFTK